MDLSTHTDYQINYLYRFLKVICSARNKAKKDPFYDKKGCKQLGIPTVAVVFSDARDRGKVNYNRRLRAEEQERKMWSIVEATWQKYHHLRKFEMTPELISRHARDLGNTIHDLPARWTGLRSTDSLADGDEVEEHFHPRQWAGHQLMNYFLTGNVTREGIRLMFEVFRQVHITTQAENMRLRDFQSSEKFVDWKTSYESAGIYLVLEEDRGPILSLDYVSKLL